MTCFEKVSFNTSRVYEGGRLTGWIAQRGQLRKGSLEVYLCVWKVVYVGGVRQSDYLYASVAVAMAKVSEIGQNLVYMCVCAIIHTLNCLSEVFSFVHIPWCELI